MPRLSRTCPGGPLLLLRLAQRASATAGAHSLKDGAAAALHHLVHAQHAIVVKQHHARPLALLLLLIRRQGAMLDVPRDEVLRVRLDIRGPYDILKNARGILPERVVRYLRGVEGGDAVSAPRAEPSRDEPSAASWKRRMTPSG